MFSDGRCTAVMLSSHPSFEVDTDEAPPLADDRWVPETSWFALSGAQGPQPWVLARPLQTRWLRISCMNDGSLGNPTYIELHGIKAYGPEAAAAWPLWTGKRDTGACTL
jgi:hypothetical protein